MRRWLLGLCIFSLVLRVISSGSELFWYDEAFTAFIVKLPFFQMLAAIRGDVHPPLWYGIEWVVAQLAGRSEFVMRLPAAAFGTAGVLELYQLVRRTGNETSARLAASLMAVLPAQIYYGEEARMYSLLTLLVIMGARAVLDRRWLRLGLCCVLIPYTQNLGFIYSGILALWGLWASRGIAFKHLAAAGAGYAPWLFVMLEQSSNMAQGFWLPPRDLSGVLYYLDYTTMFVRVPEWLQTHAVMLVIILTIASLIGIVISRSSKKALPIMVLAFLPPIILFAASQIWRPVLLERALLPAGTMVVALWGLGLSRLPGWPQKLLAGIAIPVLLAGFVTFYLDPVGQRDKSDPVIGIVDTAWQPGDVLYHLNLSSMVTYDYYLPSKPAFSLPQGGDLGQSLTDSTKIAMGLKVREKLPDDVRQMGYKRAWVFIWDSPVSSDFEMRFADDLLQHYQVEKTWMIYSSPYATFELALIQL